MRKSTILTIVTVVIALGLVATAGTVQAEEEEDTWDPIEVEDNNPEITEVGAFRLIASNDVDIDETPESRDIFDVDAATRDYRFGEDGTPLIRLDNNFYTLHQAEQLSQMTDGYREHLSGEVALSTEESWTDLSDYNIEDKKFVGFELRHPENISTQTDADGTVYVAIEERAGEIPLRNVEVEIEEPDEDEALSTDHFYLDNPHEAEIYDGNVKTYTEINRDTVHEHFPTTGEDESLVPGDGTESNEERWTTITTEVDGKWSEDNLAVDDHYAGIFRMTQGAFYKDYWVVNDDGVEVLSVTDYRILTPPDYHDVEKDGCSYSCSCGTDCTTTCYGDITRTEEWEKSDDYIAYGIEVSENGFDDNSGERDWYEEEREEDNLANIFITEIEDLYSGEIGPTSIIAQQYEVDWEKDCASSCSGCDDEGVKEVQADSQILGFFENQGFEPTGIDDIDITAYAVDNDGDSQVHFDLIGDQKPEENPLGSIHFFSNAGIADFDYLMENRERMNQWDDMDYLVIDSPYIAYPQTLYTQVESRTGGGGNIRETTVDPTSSKMQNVHRDYLAVRQYRVSNDGNHYPALQTGEEAQQFRGIDIGENVLNYQDNVTLYDSVGANIHTIDEGVTETQAKAGVTSIYGNTKEIDVVERSYRDSNIEFEYVDDEGPPEEQSIAGIHRDEFGNAIPNREIQLSNTQEETVTTDNNGEFTVTPVDDGLIRAEFEGDHFKDSVDQHHTETTTTQSVRTSLIYAFDEGPGEYIGHSIAALLSVIQFIVLGLFAVWWTRFRQKG